MKLSLGIVRATPSDQTEVDLFRGQWNYQLPLPGVQSGEAGIFLSPTLSFLDRCRILFGSFAGFSVLELGPLEGEITYHLHRLGPREIVAIEARQASYLKCLIVKNLCGLDRARFMLGDFCKYLETSNRRWDLCCMQGVLYHMVDPVRLLQLACARSDRLVLGTHYFEESKLLAVHQRGNSLCGIRNPSWNIPADHATPYTGHGLSCVLHRHLYDVTPEQQEDPDRHHHHGTEHAAYFMEKQDILAALDRFSMKVLDIQDSPEMVRGPLLEVVCQKRG